MYANKKTQKSITHENKQANAESGYFSIVKYNIRTKWMIIFLKNQTFYY